MSPLEDIEVIQPPTERQKAVLEFIAWSISRNKISPTQREIAEALELKSNTAWSYTQALIKKKFLTEDKTVGNRKLRLTEVARSYLSEKDLEKWNRRYHAN